MLGGMKPYGIVYGLYDSTGLRYIGQTTKSLKARLIAHLAPSTLRKRDHRANWLRSLVQAPTARVITAAFSRDELDRLEMGYIASARDSGHCLVNTTPGGDFKVGLLNKGRKATAETREKQRLSMIGKNVGRKPSPRAIEASRAARIGKPQSAESNAKRSMAMTGMRGHKWTPELRARLVAAHTGKKQSPEQVAKRVATQRRNREARNGR